MFVVEDNKQTGQSRVVEVRKVTYGEHDEGSNILYKESEAHPKSLQICIAFFKLMVDFEYTERVTVGKLPI